MAKNKLTKSALVAALAVSAITPVAASAAEATQFSNVVFTKDGVNYSVSYAEFNAAVGLGWINPTEVTYVVINGKTFSKDVYNAAVSAQGSTDAAKAFLANNTTNVSNITTTPTTINSGGLVPTPGQTGELKVESVSAVNGTITVQLSGEGTPQASDFAVTRTIDSGAATVVYPTLSYNATTKVATLTVAQVGATTAAQTVKYDVKLGQTTKSASFTVAANAASTAIDKAYGLHGTPDKVVVYFSSPVDTSTTVGRNVNNYVLKSDKATASSQSYVPASVSFNTTQVGSYAPGQIATLTFDATATGAAVVGTTGVITANNLKSATGAAIPSTSVDISTVAEESPAAVPTIGSDGYVSNGAALGTPAVTAGSPLVYNLTFSEASGVHNAQYRLVKPDGTFTEWTNLTPVDPPYGKANQVVRATIATAGLAVGQYGVQVRATDTQGNGTGPNPTDLLTGTAFTILPASLDAVAPAATSVATAAFSYANITTAGIEQGANTVRVIGTATDNVTIGGSNDGSVAKVEYRVREYNPVTGQFTVAQNWSATNPVDGAFGGGSENFTFVTPALKLGSSYTIETRTTDTAGNIGPITPVPVATPFTNWTGGSTASIGSVLAATSGAPAGSEVFTLAADAVAPTATSIAVTGSFTQGITATPSRIRNVDLNATFGDGETIVTKAEFAVYKIVNGQRQLIRALSTDGVTVPTTGNDGRFNSNSELVNFKYQLPNESGTYVIEAIGYDAAGNKTDVGTNNTFTHVLDVTAPTVTIKPNTATSTKNDFVVTFSEDVNTSLALGDFIITNSIGQTVATLTAADTLAQTSNTNEYIITLSASLSQKLIGNKLTFTANSITDVAGNSVPLTSYTFVSSDIE